MSTRRSTRATSRSSRAISPARSTVTTTTTTTPRTRRRAGNEPLPAVGLRTSTAYGTNTTAKAARANGPIVSDQIETVLQGLLNGPGKPSQAPAQAPPPRVASPASADRSFGLESAIFYGARFESSQPSSPPRSPTKSPEPPTTPKTAPKGLAAHVHPQDAPTVTALEKLARQRLQSAGVTEPGVFHKTYEFIKSFFEFLFSLITSIFSFDVLRLLTVALIAFIVYQAATSDFDIKSSVAEYFPDSGNIVSGNHFFTPSDAARINRRLASLEKDVGDIQKRMSSIVPDTAEQIKKILPPYLVVKKDSYGNMVIPNDFWAALQDKIRADDTLLTEQLAGPIDVGKAKGTITPKELKKEVEKVAKSHWAQYMKHNEKNLENLLNDELSARFPDILKENGIATQDEVIELIRANWAENAHGISETSKQLTRKVENVSKVIENLKKNPSSLTKEEVTSIATDVLKKLIPNAQLDALAKANLKGAIQNSIGRLNHFSLATGAIVDASVTSPTYVFPKSDVWFTTRWSRAFIGNPVNQPNGARAALTRWEEFGDCWCAASVNTMGFGPSIGVITANNIYPDQIVVEHIPQSATLTPGSAPREMELVAYLGDLETYNSVKNVSNGLFPDEDPELEHPYRYVRIASWTYDLEGETVQSFPVQIDVRSLGAHANKFIVRAKNNWGAQDEVPYTCIYRVKVHGDVAPVSVEV